ncbi:hypothetical protein AMS68_001820 [Peltaster fructicola]|uniref:EF-hand domain-containing protein n=1 Tax=Peltaster fructicola TaxID=286661 RepID=A0A6H0XNL0_9PEZI|nr:hypothetical protein AMS68_001820 [Peltaster fructicola]
MSQTQTVQQAPAIKLSEKELPKLFSVDAQKNADSKLETKKQQPLSTLDSLLFPERRPRKFDSKGKRNAEWEDKLKAMSPLQKHCAYFLPNPEANIIFPIDTYRSVRAWGWNLFLTLLTVFIIHGGLAYFSQPEGMLLPDPRFGVYISNIHRAKHGSDSGSYNSHGAYRRELFNDFFNYYDKDGKGGLTLSELYSAWRGQRIVFDPFGWSASAFEWVATYLLLWPEDGVLRKKDAEGVFDGEIFWTVKEKEDERRVKRGLKPLVY